MPDSLIDFRLTQEPFYQSIHNEIELFESAFARRLPILIKGPTGCGKTRFVQYMAWRLKRPLVTVICYEDLSVADLVGRWLLDANATQWQDGPLSQAARYGAICYLDEFVEARANTTVAIHSLTDTRRQLVLTACNQTVSAHPDFQLVVSYNPSVLSEEIRPATRQRFCALNFSYPTLEIETKIVAEESGLDTVRAHQVTHFGVSTRRLQGLGLEEGASTRMLVGAASLVVQGLSLHSACRMAIVDALTDVIPIHQALMLSLDAAF